MSFARGFTPWHEFDDISAFLPAGLLREVARHMENGYNHRDQPNSTRFRAGHQLAHKGWRFPAGLYDASTGQVTPGIKAIRALMITGKHSWFADASLLIAMSNPDSVTPADVADPGARKFVEYVGRGEPLYRVEGGEWVILMCRTTDGWRIAGVVVRDAEAAGIKDALVMSAAMSPGCLVPALSVLALAAAVLGVTA
jgi:hypothetical protein